LNYLINFASIIPFYIYILAGLTIIVYKILDLHLEYRNNVKKCKKDEITGEEFNQIKEMYFSEFKKKAIIVSLIIGIFTVALTVLSYMGK